jgi:two-component system LytT family response regulator
MFSIRVFVADHESVWRRRIRRYLSLEPGCHLVGECATGAEAEAAMTALRPDILFLASQASNHLQETIRGPLPLIVVTSPRIEPGPDPFPFHLAKPFNILQFREMLERVKARLLRDRLVDLYEDMSRSRRSPDRIAVRAGGRVVFVKVTEIDWIQAADNYVCLHCGRVTHIVRETMKELESRLDPAQFPRIHRSAIINVDHVKELQPWFRGDYRILLQDGTELTLSKSYRANVESLLLRGIGTRSMVSGIPA